MVLFACRLSIEVVGTEAGKGGTMHCRSSRMMQGEVRGYPGPGSKILPAYLDSRRFVVVKPQRSTITPWSHYIGAQVHARMTTAVRHVPAVSSNVLHLTVTSEHEISFLSTWT